MRVRGVWSLVVALLLAAVVAVEDDSFNPITAPAPDDTLYAGEIFTIRWSNNTADPISLVLYFWGTEQNWILADNIPNFGMYQWWVNDQIAYPTLVNTPYAGDPYWFEMHIYNGGFRNTIGPNADSYVGDASDMMLMSRGGLWFNITAPIYAVQIFNVITVNPTSFSTISGGTTETFPITWATVASPLNNNVAVTAGSSIGPTAIPTNKHGTTGATGYRTPTFASISGAMVISGNANALWGIIWAGFAVAIGALVVL